MDLSSIFVYILKIDILLMKSYIDIPDEIDKKLKKNHNLLSRQIRKTQTFLIFQQISMMIMLSSGFFFFLRIFLILALPFIGVVSFFLYIIIRFIKETIVIRQEYFLKEKQNLNYLSEELLMMIKIYTSKFRIFKGPKMRKPLFQDNRVSMDVKMGLILKHEKQSFISELFIIIIFLIYGILFSDFRIVVVDISMAFILISMVLYIIISYFVLKTTNKWMNGYHELNAWGDLLDKYEIIPKQRYMALLDKDFNNLEISSDEYCGKCGEFLELNAQFCRFCGRRKESN